MTFNDDSTRPGPCPGRRYRTGNRSYRAGGMLDHLPVTTTDPLSAYGGA